MRISSRYVVAYKSHRRHCNRCTCVQGAAMKMNVSSSEPTFVDGAATLGILQSPFAETAETDHCFDLHLTLLPTNATRIIVYSASPLRLRSALALVMWAAPRIA